MASNNWWFIERWLFWTRYHSSHMWLTLQALLRYWYVKLNWTMATEITVISHSALTLSAIKYRVYLKCLDKLQEWVSHTKTMKYVHIFICSQTLEIQPPGSSYFIPLYSYLWDTISILCSSPIENEETPDQRNFDGCQTIRYRLRTFGWVQLSMIRRVRAGVLVQVGDILSIRRELRPHKQHGINSY